MCLILVGYRTHAEMPLIIAANRDELHTRASSTADFWSDAPNVLAGRDLVAGGTWLGCTRDGRFAALTNFTDPDDPPAPKSRGLLVQNFLTGSDSAEHYAHHLNGPDYAGFNLLLFDGEDMVYTSNKGTTEILEPGFFGLSNAELGAKWPKCEQGALALEHIVQSDNGQSNYDVADLIGLLHDSDVPADEALPHRGRPIEFERRLAPCFIVGEEYGTRASTVVLLGNEKITFAEQSYLAGGVSAGLVDYEFQRAEVS